MRQRGIILTLCPSEQFANPFFLQDDETQAYLSEFFVKAAQENVAGFNELYGALTDQEKLKLNELAHTHS